jgi:hypothetical protein
VRFDENYGSHVEQVGVCDVGDEVPSRAIRRIAVGHLIPIEEHLLVEGEGLCSIKWSIHFHKLNKLHKANLMQTKDKLKTLTQVGKTKIKTKYMMVNLHQWLIKAKLKLISKLKMKVKARTKMVVMTKWFLKSLLKKLKLTERRRLRMFSAKEVTHWRMSLEV